MFPASRIAVSKAFEWGRRLRRFFKSKNHNPEPGSFQSRGQSKFSNSRISVLLKDIPKIYSDPINRAERVKLMMNLIEINIKLI